MVMLSCEVLRGYVVLVAEVELFTRPRLAAVLVPCAVSAQTHSFVLATDLTPRPAELRDWLHDVTGG